MKDKYLIGAIVLLIFDIKVFLARRSKILDKYFAKQTFRKFKKRVDKACKEIDLSSDNIDIIW